MLFRSGVDHDALGKALNKALYNFMHGIGLEEDVRAWFDAERETRSALTGAQSTTTTGGYVVTLNGPGVESADYAVRAVGRTNGTATTDRFGAAIRWNEAGSAGYYA